MPNMGRLCRALAVPFVLSAAAAEAQVDRSALAAPVEAGLSVVPARSGLPDFRMPRSHLREVDRPSRSGLIASLPMTDNLHVAVGRFRVPDIDQPVADSEIRRRDRGVAALGLSVRF